MDKWTQISERRVFLFCLISFLFFSLISTAFTSVLLYPYK